MNKLTNLLKYDKTPVIELRNAISKQSGIRILVKREDLNHPEISGNKWWKLKYNLEAATSTGQTLLTFGGAYSNHIYATAAAAKELQLKSIGIIRGEETLPLNATLSFATQAGMKLKYVSRDVYRRKNETAFLDQLRNEFGEFYWIPEGGTNDLAIKGCTEFGESLLSEIKFDYVCLPVGTGGTMAGVINGVREKRVIGFSSLKGGEFLEDEIKKFTTCTNWEIMHDYHFGGYAKSTPTLNDFIQDFEKEFKIPLDPVYTSKMMFGVFDLMRKGFFKPGSTVLLIHTGGLQGRQE